MVATGVCNVTLKVVSYFRVPDPCRGSVRDSHLKPFVKAARTSLLTSGPRLAWGRPGRVAEASATACPVICSSEEGPHLRDTPIPSLCLHVPGLRMFGWWKRQINIDCFCISALRWRITGPTDPAHLGHVNGKTLGLLEGRVQGLQRGL